MDLITLGESFEDLVLGGLERVPGEGEELLARSFTRSIGGGAVITAVAAARLGSRVSVVSGLPAGGVALLRSERIAVRDLRRPGEPHATTIGLATARDRTFVTYAGANDELHERLAAAVPRLRARHVHFAFRPRDCRAWAELVARVAQGGATTSWDFGWHEDLARAPGFTRLLGAVDLISVNHQEARLYTGERTDAAAARALARVARSVLIKCGARGARLVERARRLDIQIPAPRVRVVDTVGAGDALNGGFLHALLHGASPLACLRAGVTVASRSVTAAGGIAGLPRGLRRRRA